MQRRIVPLLVAAFCLAAGIILCLSPVTRIAVFGQWGFSRLLPAHQKAEIINRNGNLLQGELFAYGAGFRICEFVPVWIHVERGPLLRLYEEDRYGSKTETAVVREDAAGVFTVSLKDLDVELHITVQDDSTGDRALVTMRARPSAGGS